MDTSFDNLSPQAFRDFLQAARPEGEDLAAVRARLDRRGLSIPLPAGCEVGHEGIGALAAERLTPRGAQAGRWLLYLHGGGYQVGSPRSVRHLAARLAEGAGAQALVPDYRLAPEHRFPAPVEDALAAYRWLLERTDPGRIVIGGDSAGAGLALSTALAARRDGLPAPAGLYLISPWVDLVEGGASYAAKAESDIFVSAEALKGAADAYAGDQARDTLASPLFADLAKSPPMLIQVGSEEILLSDSTRLAERAGLAKVPVRLTIEPEMLHDYPLFLDQLAAARRAVAEAGAWMSERLGG